MTRSVFHTLTVAADAAAALAVVLVSVSTAPGVAIASAVGVAVLKGIATVLNRILYVSVPPTPSASRLLRSWKFFRAFTLARPKMPSTLPR